MPYGPKRWQYSAVALIGPHFSLMRAQQPLPAAMELHWWYVASSVSVSDVALRSQEEHPLAYGFIRESADTTPGTILCSLLPSDYLDDCGRIAWQSVNSCYAQDATIELQARSSAGVKSLRPSLELLWNH